MRTTSSVSESGETESETHSVLIWKIGSHCEIDSIKKGKLKGI